MSSSIDKKQEITQAVSNLLRKYPDNTEDVLGAVMYLTGVSLNTGKRSPSAKTKAKPSKKEKGKPSPKKEKTGSSSKSETSKAEGANPSKDEHQKIVVIDSDEFRNSPVVLASSYLYAERSEDSLKRIEEAIKKDGWNKSENILRRFASARRNLQKALNKLKEMYRVRELPENQVTRSDGTKGSKIPRDPLLIANFLNNVRKFGLALRDLVFAKGNRDKTGKEHPRFTEIDLGKTLFEEGNGHAYTPFDKASLDDLENFLSNYSEDGVKPYTQDPVSTFWILPSKPKQAEEDEFNAVSSATRDVLERTKKQVSSS